MNINVEKVTRAMLGAARAEVADRWPAARAIAEFELGKLASTFAEMQKRLAAGDITLPGARALIRMQENCARSVLCTVEGISLLTSGRAVSAAMGAAATLVNPVIGVGLIQAARLLTEHKPEVPAGSSSKPDSKQKAVVATRPARASRTSTASAEPAEETTPSFKAGKDL